MKWKKASPIPPQADDLVVQALLERALGYRYTEETRERVSQGFCTCELVEGVDNLYIVVELEGESHTALIEIQEHHNNITYMVRDGQVLLDNRPQPDQEKNPDGADRMQLNVANILEFANAVRLEDVRELIARQIAYNTAISEEGLKGNYGVETGRILMENAADASGLNQVRLQARAAAAAGSDARMSGCSLPVVINSGSGNQGITVTMPIVIYGRAWKVEEDLLYRALVLGNLISVHQKKYIGSLSAYCGATSAATGAACGVAYMRLNQTNEPERIYQVLCDTITNSIETLGGMVCDGAKASCAAKIGLAVENALMALELELHRLDCLSSHAKLDLYDYAQAKLSQYAAQPLLPPPLVTGKDLIALGHTPGPKMGRLLQKLYTLQLEGATRETLLQRGGRA